MTLPPAMIIKNNVEKTMIANGLLISFILTNRGRELTQSNPPSDIQHLRILMNIYIPNIPHLLVSCSKNIALGHYMMLKMNRSRWKSNMYLRVLCWI
jgi:hypothetical protein